MSHNRDKIITQRILPLFAEPDMREHLSTRTCERIDAMASQTEFSDRDVRCLARAISDAIDA